MGATIWSPGTVVGQTDAGDIDYDANTTYPNSTVGKHLRDQAIVVTDSPFLAASDGTTDVAASVQSALNEFGAAGGTLILPPSWKGYLGSDITIPRNVTVRGGYQRVGNPGTNLTARYGDLGSKFVLNPLAKIFVQGNAGIHGIVTVRQGLTFPVANSSAFAGTAFELLEDDAFLDNSLIAGFQYGVRSSGEQRPRFSNLNMDNLNCIDIENAMDVPYVSQVHCWPFMTIAGGGGSAGLRRAGTGISVKNIADWAKIFNSFTYGYAIGFKSTSADNVTFLNAGADNTTGWSSSGFQIDGSSQDNRLIGCQAAAQENGFFQNTGTGQRTWYTNCDAWVNANHGYLLTNGHSVLLGGSIRDVGNGITIENNVPVDYDFIKFSNISGIPVNCTSANNTLRVGDHNDYGNFVGAPVGSNYTQLAIASASSIALPARRRKTYQITGTTNISTITGGCSDDIMTLRFTAALTVVHGTGGNAIDLNGNVNFTVAAGSTLTLGYDGVRWFELGRST